MRADVEVIPATADQEAILANLLELYIHDFSEFLGIEIGVNGRFGYDALPLYWRAAHRHPFIVRVGGRVAGFALVFFTEQAWDVQEFFIVRAHRRRGAGTCAVHELWRRLKGPWTVRVRESNRPAQLFWEKAIAGFTGNPVKPSRMEKNGEGWFIYSFMSN
jgi:predicted acetyltransferase